ncbi:MAG: CHAT domain-containing protein [Potamolinea sp.]
MEKSRKIRVSFNRNRRQKPLLILLLIGSFFLVQVFALFGGSGILPVSASFPKVEQASSLLFAQNSPNPQSLIEQGKTLYNQGKFSQAVAVLKQALVVFQKERNVLEQAMTLSNLSLAYQQLGLWKEAEQAISESLNLLQYGENIAKSTDKLKVIAQTLDIQGKLQLSVGRSEQALNIWQQAAAIHTQVGNKTGAINSKLNQAQALQTLGFYRRSLTTLTELNQILQNQPDSLTKAVGLRSFGDALQLVGNLQESEKVLKQSLDIAQKLQSADQISAALFSLGNTARLQQKGNTEKTRQITENALSYYQQAAAQATSPTTKLQAQLNQLSLIVETINKNCSPSTSACQVRGESLPEVQSLLSQIPAQLNNLPANRTAVYARINLAQSLIKLSAPGNKQAAQLLATAAQQAKNLGDQRAEAYALGSLGSLYEQTRQVKNALEITNQSLLLAQTINAPDIAYRWQWQLGRLLKAQENWEGAIAAYESAVKSLESLRGDLVSINPDVQFSFRESVEPVYRELVALLLQSPNPRGDSSATLKQNNLDKARNVIESLQQAELRNFFREDCLTGFPGQIDKVDPKAAVIYPIILPDRLEVVLSLPNTPLRHYTTAISQSEVEAVFASLRKAIAPESVDPNSRSTPGKAESPQSPGTEIDQHRGGLGSVGVVTNYLPQSQKVYNWLIRPAEQDIAKSDVKTLVFVLDSSLLNLPMAVLHDGKQFLVEKYAIAYTPGLQLLDPNKPLTRSKLSALKAGISKYRELKLSGSEQLVKFPALGFVEQELEKIKPQLSGPVLLNEQFTSAAIQQAIQSVPFPIVHLATHGLFSSNAEETFILTWDGSLNIDQLNTKLRSREISGKRAIELLVLSACQTATGDKRAALGLAGVAVKAGARSTLATLWFVSDQGTAELMTQFYQGLADPTISKAEALRRAQVTLLKNSRYQQPRTWAPYVLVGNWL